MKPAGTFRVTGIGQVVKDIDGVKIPLSGEVRLAGMVKQATLSVSIPNSLLSVFVHAFDHPVKQIPMFDGKLLRLSITKA